MNASSATPRARTFVVILGLTLAAATPALAGKPLRWKLAKGDKFAVELSQQTRQIMKTGDRTVDIPVTMIMNITWTVDDVDDQGVAHETQIVDRIRMKMSVPGAEQNVDIDTKSTEEPEGLAKNLADMVTPMVGVEFKQKMNDRGKVFDVEVPQKAFQGLAGNPLIKQFFSSKAFSDMLAKVSPVLPAEAVDRGHTWEQNSSSKTLIGTVDVASKYTYLGEEKREDRTLDKIGMTMTMAIKPDGALGATIEITDQDCSGNLYFDSAGGYLSESASKQKMTQKITAGDQIINQTIEAATKMAVRRLQE